MRSNAFKRWPAFNVTVIILQLSITIKTFHYYSTRLYKDVLKLHKHLACIATHFLVISPYSRDFL